MRNPDLWMLDKLDSLTTKLQKRGYLLTNIHVHVSGATLAATVGYAYSMDRMWLLALAGTIWGLYFSATARWAARNQDYPSSLKMVERLNAMALHYRETIWLRWALLASSFLGMPMWVVHFHRGAWGILALDVASDILPILAWYLNCCFFIGPGEFAKERKESFQGTPVGETHTG